jgi:thiol-disulfide isomerase/thioredoxin
MPDPAPNFSGPDLLGGPPFNLADHKGSYVFIAFMGLPWCGPCKLELPHLAAVAQEYALNPATPDVHFVIVNSRLGYQNSSVVALTKAENITLPILDDDNIMNAYTDSLSWPQSYMVKPSGALCAHHLKAAAGADQLQAFILQCGAAAPGKVAVPTFEWGDQPPPVVVLNPYLGGLKPSDIPIPIPVPTPDPRPYSLHSRQLMRALALHDAADGLAEREGRRQVRGAALKAAAVTLRRLESLADLEAEHGPLPLPPIGPPRER